MTTHLRQQFKKMALVGALALLTGSLMTACSTRGSDRSDTMGNKGVARVAEKTYKFKGRIEYSNEGRFYYIVSDRGRNYYPLNLQNSYRRVGLRVQVYGQTRGYAKGGSMRAIHIYEISRPARD